MQHREFGRRGVPSMPISPDVALAAHGNKRPSSHAWRGLIKSRLFALSMLIVSISVLVLLFGTRSPRTAEELELQSAAEARAQEDRMLEQRADECGNRNAPSAYAVTQDAVRSSLRAPSSASFPWMSDIKVASISLARCEFGIVGYVDSQNGFGAMLRTYYQAEVRHSPENDGWAVTKLQFLN